MVYGRDVHVAAFNASATPKLKNEIIRLDANEVLDLSIVNHDSLIHTFTIDGISSVSVNPFDSIFTSISFPANGTYRYYSNESYGQLCGASGIILVGYEDNDRYAWNLFEMHSSLTLALASDSLPSIPPSSEPDLFLINGKYFPQSLQDVDGHVYMNVGDTATIGIVNSGDMDHVFHFHGFHVKILQASVSNTMAGWIKDTFPIKKGEAITVRLVADQAGEYPVHDHNLIAVTNAGLYPGGMITRLSVFP
jgi:FtsP/CotA-like multicopper oxidase with cupredoxin domain